MSILDRDMAFCFDYIQQLQKVGIETMELAQETARQYEASMTRLRSYLAELPREVDTRDVTQLLDDNQGTMDLPIFEETKQYFRNRLSNLVERINQIDLETMNEFAQLTDSSRKLTWQYESLVQMIGKGSDSLNMTEFQSKLTQVMEVGENPALRELIRVEDGAFVYQWAEISRLLEQKKLSDQELNALLKAFKLTLYEKEGREELYQQWLEQIKQALSGMEPGSHQHLAALIRQCGELVVFDVISRVEYEDLEAQYLWSQLTKLEQDKTMVLLEAEANKEFLMAEYGLTEEEFRLYKENLCVMLELWDEYEEKIEKYSALTMQERIDRYEFGANPITEFIFLSQWPEFTKAERTAFMEEIQEHGLLSNQAYERIVGEAPNKDATAMIELTYRASLTRMTFDEMIQQDAQERSARLNQFIGGVLLMNLMDINANDQNPAPYDGNLNPIYRLDQMELNSKNGFKNYAYVPLSRETMDWLREHDTSLNLVIEGGGKGAGEAVGDIGYMKNAADPMKDAWGSGRISNPDEWNSLIEELEAKGVEIRYRDGSMAYAPGMSDGNPGQLLIDPDASLSALKHEYQHFLDAQAEGFPSFGKQMFENPQSRVIKELRAYMVEIKEAEKLGLKNIAEQLFENYRRERSWIVDEYIIK